MQPLAGLPLHLRVLALWVRRLGLLGQLLQAVQSGSVGMDGALTHAWPGSSADMGRGQQGGSLEGECHRELLECVCAVGSQAGQYVSHVWQEAEGVRLCSTFSQQHEHCLPGVALCSRGITIYEPEQWLRPRSSTRLPPPPPTARCRRPPCTGKCVLSKLGMHPNLHLQLMHCGLDQPEQQPLGGGLAAVKWQLGAAASSAGDSQQQRRCRCSKKSPQNDLMPGAGKVPASLSSRHERMDQAMHVSPGLYPANASDLRFAIGA